MDERVKDFIEDVEEVVDAAEEASAKAENLLLRIARSIKRLVNYFKGLFKRKD